MNEPLVSSGVRRPEIAGSFVIPPIQSVELRSVTLLRFSSIGIRVSQVTELLPRNPSTARSIETISSPTPTLDQRPRSR